MAYIDLERQSQPVQRGKEVLVSTEVTQSSGLYEWEQKPMTPEFIGTGSMVLGASGDLTARSGYFYTGLYSTGSLGSNLGSLGSSFSNNGSADPPTVTTAEIAIQRSPAEP